MSKYFDVVQRQGFHYGRREMKIWNEEGKQELSSVGSYLDRQTGR